MWAVAIALNLAILYGIHPYHKDNYGFIEPMWLNDLFAATFKTVWGTGVSLDNVCLSHRMGR